MGWMLLTSRFYVFGAASQFGDLNFMARMYTIEVWSTLDLWVYRSRCCVYYQLYLPINLQVLVRPLPYVLSIDTVIATAQGPSRKYSIVWIPNIWWSNFSRAMASSIRRLSHHCASTVLFEPLDIKPDFILGHFLPVLASDPPIFWQSEQLLFLPPPPSRQQHVRLEKHDGTQMSIIKTGAPTETPVLTKRLIPLSPVTPKNPLIHINLWSPWISV